MSSFDHRNGEAPKRGHYLPLWLLVALLLVAGWLHTFGLIADDRARTVAAAKNELVNLGRVSQEHAERTFSSADLALRLVLGQYREHKGKLDLQAMTEQGVFDAPLLQQIAILDAQGILLQSTPPVIGRVDQSDRDHFKAHLAADGNALFISRPVPGRESGQWSIQLSRRIILGNGQLGGVVVASIDPAYLTHFYSELKLGKQGGATLSGVDGAIRARKIADRDEFTGDLSASPVLLRMAQGETAATVSRGANGDAFEWIAHFRKLPSYPLLVMVEMAGKDVFAEHIQKKSQLLWQAVIVSFLLLALAVIASWYGVVRRRHWAVQQHALLRLQALTSHIPGLVYQYLRRPDGSSCFPFASDGMRDIYRLRPEDVIKDASPVFAVIHPDDVADVAASIEASARTLTPWVHEYRVRFADGTIRWLSGSAAPQKLADGSVLWHGFISDTTQHKQAERSLLSLSAAVEQSPVSIVITDLGGFIKYVNPMFERVSGYTRTELIGQNPRIMSSGEKPTEEYREMWATLLAGKVWTGEFHNRRKDGTLLWERAVMSAVLDGKGVPVHYLSIKEDVTEHKRQEAALIAERARLHAILDAIPDLLFELGLDGRYHAYYSRRTDLLAAPPEDFLGRLVSDILPPDAAAAIMTALQDARTSGHSSGKQFALVLPQGKRWFELSVARKATLPMEAPRFIVISRDITERKLADAKLRIAAAAFESQEGMCITDADAVILRVNQAYSKITGYSAKEAVGQKTSLHSSGRHDAAFYGAMWASIKQSGSWQGEIWNRRKNGEVFPEWLSISAVRDEESAVTHYVSTLTDITKRKAAEAEIQQLAFYDPLTKLPNRRLLAERLKQALASSIRYHRNGALLFIDLDNFKNLNDTQGHDQGDLLLQQVAQRLSDCVREGDTVARQGGDEFVVMLENLSENPREAAAQAEVVGEKILVALRRPHHFSHFTHFGSASVGVALLNESNDSMDELLKRADLALYQAKDAGRNTLRFFDPEMQAALVARAALETDLRHGLKENQFLLYYQPQVDELGRLTGVEALVRWQHPRHGMVSPAQFIPLAEETGLILPLGQWVLETACRQLKAIFYLTYPK